MTSVPAGSRLVLCTDAGDVPLRSVREVDLVEGWAIPVIAPASVLGHGEGRLRLSTSGGPAELSAHLVAGGGQLVLRAGKAAPGATVVVQQRRADVREEVELGLRGAVVDALGQDALAETTIDGATVSVSAGGLRARLEAARVEAALDAPAGARLYLELELPGGQLVPCVVCVVELRGGLLRARFVDIAPVDRERLVRLVFAEQRLRLAERRLVRDRG